jgi:ABC-type multidrug transport system fused ATPase/permease subunit
MVKSPTNPSLSNRPGKLSTTGLIRPYWKTLTLAFIAVLGESLSDVLEPWPIKIVIDNVLQSKTPAGWLGRFVLGMFGADKLAVLNFAVAAVAGHPDRSARGSHETDTLPRRSIWMLRSSTAPHSRSSSSGKAARTSVAWSLWRRG